MLEVVSTSLGAAVTDTSGLALVNPTPATAATPVQNSPAALWQGSAYSAPNSVVIDFLAYLAPATSPVGGALVFQSAVGAVSATSYTNPIVFTTAGSVGIGTTNPLSKLDVAGGAALGNYAATSAAPTSGLIVSSSVGIGLASPKNLLDVLGAVAIGAYAGTGAPASGAIVSGSVGLGTTTPLNQLDVFGAVALGSYAGTNVAPASSLIVSGSVGIATTNPTASLDVRGNLALITTAAATVGHQVYNSPSANWQGNAWNGTSGLAQTVNFAAFVQPATTGGTPSGFLMVTSAVGGTPTGGSIALSTSGWLGIGGQPNTSLDVVGSVSLGLTIPLAGFTMAATDCLVFADATTAAFTVTLPSSLSFPGRVVFVKKVDGTLNAVTVAAISGQTIEGAGSIGLANPYNSVTLLSAGTARWYKLATT